MLGLCTDACSRGNLYLSRGGYVSRSRYLAPAVALAGTGAERVV